MNMSLKHAVKELLRLTNEDGIQWVVGQDNSYFAKVNGIGVSFQGRIARCPTSERWDVLYALHFDGLSVLETYGRLRALYLAIQKNLQRQKEQLRHRRIVEFTDTFTPPSNDDRQNSSDSGEHSIFLSGSI